MARSGSSGRGSGRQDRISIAVLARRSPASAAPRRGDDRRRPHPGAAARRPAGSPAGTPAAEAPSAGTLSLVSAETTPAQVLLLRRTATRSLQLRDRQHPAAERPPRSTSSTPPAKSSRSFYRNDVEPERRDERSAGTARPAQGRPARNGRYSFRVVPQAGTAQPRGRAHVDLDARRSASASPSTATPSRSSARTNSAARAGRFGAARSGHTHQGQDVMAACGTAAGRRPRRHGPVRRLPERRRQLHRHRRQGHRPTTSCTRTSPNPRRCRPANRSAPASRSGSSATPATPPPATSTSRSGRAPGWYEGGSPIDPLPYLEKWDRYS